ncbi:MAG TPA: YaaA family protein [Patescibacteria group bacterium]|nr:YaaA family protein [Patescibacteria group bacterium]
MIILIHTSKTMRGNPGAADPLRRPALLDRADILATYVQTLTAEQLARIMHLSPALASKTHTTFSDWTVSPERQALAVDSFIGDIYSGLRASTLSGGDRDYADEHLRILSGLYGILRPYDGICPYRLEMGYKFPARPYANLYAYWGDAIAATLPKEGLIVNLSSVEYSKVVVPFVDGERIVTPKFLTMDKKTGTPVFAVVHAKIARGAFARWLVTSRMIDETRFKEFADIGYRYDESLSTSKEPTFVCQDFGGKGLSMRLDT